MKLNQVTLPVTNLAQAEQFYLQLGLVQIVASEQYARFLMPENQATLSLSLTDKSVPNPSKIYFEFDSLELLEHKIKQLTQHNIKISQAITAQRYLWHEAVINDPSGNILILFYAGDNRINPPWRITKQLSTI